MKKLRNFKKIPGSLGIDGKSQSTTQNQNFDNILKNCEKLAVRHSKETPILLDYLNLSTIFCP